MTGNRSGITLIELVVAMTLGLLLIAGVAPMVRSSGRALEQQTALREVQVALHVTGETLIRGIRSANEMVDGTTATELRVRGGELTEMCGAEVFAIWVDGLGLHCGPVGGPSVRRITPVVSELDLSYGLDTIGNGAVDLFVASPALDELADALAVRFVLRAEHVEGRGEADVTADFVAVVRNAVLARMELEDGG